MEAFAGAGGDLAGLRVRVVVVVIVAVDLLLVGLLKLHVDAVGLVDVALFGAGLDLGGLEVKVGDLLAEVGEEGEPLFREGHPEERLRLLLLLLVALLLVLEGDEHLLDGALQEGIPFELS